MAPAPSPLSDTAELAGSSAGPAAVAAVAADATAPVAGASAPPPADTALPLIPFAPAGQPASAPSQQQQPAAGGTPILFDRAWFTFQADSQSRMAVDPAGVLTVSMDPADRDKATGKPTQRNELRFTHSGAVLEMGQIGTFDLDFRVNEQVPWAVSGGSHYYLMQLKRTGDDRPVVGFGIKNSKLAVYRGVGGTTSLADIQPGSWHHVQATLRYGSSSAAVQWALDGHTGTFVFPIKKISQPQMYLKLGIYRSLPNPITRTTSVSFRNAALKRF